MIFIRETMKVAWLNSRVETPFLDAGIYESTVARISSTEEHKHRKKWKCPSGVDYLENLQLGTRLDNVLGTGSPTTVFTNANIRQCT